MAGTNERFISSDQIWYDANNPGALHEALRADYARARAAAERRPSLRRHMDACPECLAIAGGVTAAPAQLATRRRMKVRIGPAEMHALLKLPANYEIVHMYADNDPNFVYVLVAGEGLPAADPAAETPSGRLADVPGNTLPKAS